MTSTTVLLELEADAAWVAAEKLADGSGVPLRVAKVDTGAGEVVMDDDDRFEGVYGLRYDDGEWEDGVREESIKPR